VPLLLLWGDLDPWMTPSRATKIMGLYPAATRVSLQSGHCPHDDTPEEANAALLKFLDDLPS
jgi:pimeloyl-ACP methyl ester carboxylesterase